MRKLLLLAAMIGLLSLIRVDVVFAQALDAPVAADDFYTIKVDSTLTLDMPGMLGNDDIAMHDSLLLWLVDSPLNGSLELQANGAFVYTPNAGFSGVDAFTYMLESVPRQIIDIDHTASTLKFNMRVKAGAAGSARDSIETAVGGAAELYLDPELSPFTQAHLYDLNLVVVDSVDLSFRFGGLITLGRLYVSADSGSFRLNFSQRGMPADVLEGIFNQTGNKISIAGTVDLRGTGALAPFVPDGSQDFDTETDVDIEGTIAQEDTLITLATPVSLYEEFQLSGTDIELTVTGNISGAGRFLMHQQSNLATVSITVEPLSNTATEDELPFRYALDQNYPNPFNPVTTIAFSIPTSEFVTLKVYDTLGREVATLIDGMMTPGPHEVQFDAGQLPSGMYIYHLEASGFNQSRKLILLK